MALTAEEELELLELEEQELLEQEALEAAEMQAASPSPSESLTPPTEAPIASEEPLEAEMPSTAEAAGLGLASGASFGFSDEIYGAWKAVEKKMTEGKDFTEEYLRYRDLARDKEKLAQETSPWAYGAGQVAGGIGSTLVGGAALGAVKGGAAAAGAVKAADATNKGLNFAKWGKLAGLAGAESGAVGAGLSETEFAGAEDKLQAAGEIGKEAASSAAMGAGLGVGLGVVGKGLKGMAKGIADTKTFDTVKDAFEPGFKKGKRIFGQKFEDATAKKVNTALTEVPEMVRHEEKTLQNKIHGFWKNSQKVKADYIPDAELDQLMDNFVTRLSNDALPAEQGTVLNKFVKQVYQELDPEDAGEAASGIATDLGIFANRKPMDVERYRQIRSHLDELIYSEDGEITGKVGKLLRDFKGDLDDMVHNKLVKPEASEEILKLNSQLENVKDAGRKIDLHKLGRKDIPADVAEKKLMDIMKALGDPNYMGADKAVLQDMVDKLVKANPQLALKVRGKLKLAADDLKFFGLSDKDIQLKNPAQLPSRLLLGGGWLGSGATVVGNTAGIVAKSAKDTAQSVGRLTKAIPMDNFKKLGELAKKRGLPIADKFSKTAGPDKVKRAATIFAAHQSPEFRKAMYDESPEGEE
jgi:hypothetical protein